MKSEPNPISSDRDFAAGLQLLRISDLCRLLRISKPTLWRLRQRADFPVPTEISHRVIGWPRVEIQSWMNTRRRSRVHPTR